MDYIFDPAVQKRFDEARRMRGLSDDGKILYDRLYRLRRHLAEKTKTSAYRVIPGSVLIDLVESPPENLAEMGRLRGMGVLRLSCYGDALLDAISAHRRVKRSNAAAQGVD